MEGVHVRPPLHFDGRRLCHIGRTYVLIDLVNRCGAATPGIHSRPSPSPRISKHDLGGEDSGPVGLNLKVRTRYADPPPKGNGP